METRHRELLDIVNCVRYFQYDLVGIKFTLFNDHLSLVEIMNAKNRGELSTKILNGLIYLLNFNFDVIHEADNDPIIQVADALSRTTVTKEDLVQLFEKEDIPEWLFNLMHLPISTKNYSPSQKYFIRSTVEHITDKEQNEQVPDPSEQKKTTMMWISMTINIPQRK